MKKELLNVEGMSCGHCVSSIESALKDLDGVKNIEVSLENKTVLVEFENIELSQIQDVIEDVGFDVVK